MQINESPTAPVLAALGEDEVQINDTREKPDQFTTSSGIVFKLRPVAPLLIIDVQRRFKAPEPPKLPNYDKGDGDDAPLEENPSDPAYLRAVQEHNMQVGEASNAVFLTRGTEIISIPDGIDKVDDAEWADDVREFAGLEVPAVGRRRYYCWLKYVALSSMDDFQGLLNKLTSLGGVTLESEVQAAEETFRPAEDGNADPGVRAS